MGDLPAELYTPPDRDVRAATGRHPRSDAMYTEGEDNREPPAFIDTGHRDFPWDFETVLGYYDPEKRHITRFSKGITFVAEKLKVSPALVDRIVRYHELAHAMHHLGVATADIMPEEATKLLSKNNITYRAAPTETKEQIAQLATLVVIRTRREDVSSTEARSCIDLMLEAFSSLMRRQSPCYQLPSTTWNAKLSHLGNKLRLLLDMSDEGMFPSAEFIARIIE
jgi:hypothetical protein